MEGEKFWCAECETWAVQTFAEVGTIQCTACSALNSAIIVPPISLIDFKENPLFGVSVSDYYDEIELDWEQL